MAEQRLSTSTSILIAGAMIAVGAFFGLRTREHASAPPSTATPPTSSTATPEAAPTTPRAEATQAALRAEAASATAPQVDRAKVEALVRDRFEPLRKELASKCWKPALAPSGRYEIKLVYAFDAEGRELSRGTLESRAHGSPEITRCVLDALTQLTLPPIGAGASELVVPVVFPL
jgi:hypothetical protein